MNALDHFVVIAYLSGLLFLGYRLREQKAEADYYLGGRRIGWFPLTLSTMATQLSAISFISAPAFVGLREGGGLRWLTYELGLPIAMLLIMFVIAPALYHSGVVSIYDYLEKRFARSTRVMISVAFQIVRAFSTGIMVYAMSIILQAVLGMPQWQSILAVGVITMVYSASGGMRAVVYGDALQMGLIVIGLGAVGIYALLALGDTGLASFWAQVEPSRLVTADFDALGFDGDQFGFWPMLFGGIVLYASYYGCDQTEAQRLLSARSLGDTRRVLLMNSLLRFPLVVLYCFVGLAVGVVMQGDPALLAKVPVDRPDFMMPIFILEYLPHGMIGVLLVAVMAAAMSSLSSAVNSLSAVSLEDLNTLGIQPRDEGHTVRWARIISVVWGLLILALSLFAGAIAPTVIEAINKVGSALFGPVLAVFLLAILRRQRSPIGANVGLLVGVGVNLYLWRGHPEIFWMWWNVIGFVVTLTVASSIRALTSPAFLNTERAVGSLYRPPVVWRAYAAALIGWFALIVAFIVVVVPRLQGALPEPTAGDVGQDTYTEEAVAFTAGVDRLAGVLLRPLNKSTPAVAVMVTGRGNGERGEMLHWGELLASHGVAALVFDSRGTGDSTLRAPTFTSQERFEDVDGALDFLSTMGDLGCAGLFANSAGGWVAPTVAARRDDVAFLVTLVAPAESLDDQQGHVTVAFMEQADEGYSAAEFSEAFAYQKQTVVLAQSDAPWSAFEAINGLARQARWAEHALIPESLDDADLDYFRRRPDFGIPPWPALDIPALAIFGALDPIVPPKVNVPLLRAATRSQADVTIVTIPGVDHSLGAPGDEAGAVHQQVLTTLVDWFEARFTGAGGRCDA
ncbi:MAG: alpha/beta fold hydrolase [Pseudomonadota bacterium]